MKLKIVIISLAVFLSGAAACSCYLLEKVKTERDVYKANTSALLSEVQHYEVYLADTLQAVSLPEISLRLSEYGRYRQEDRELIEALRVDNKRLAQVITTQTQTINQLKNIPVREKIVEIPVPSEAGEIRYRTDTLRCLDIVDPWYELHGCIDVNSSFSGTLASRDSLLYVEHIIPRRFLGFLWKYGVRERRQEIVSRNPNTEILCAEFVTIRN